MGGAFGGIRPVLCAIQFGCSTRVSCAELVKCRPLWTGLDRGRRFFGLPFSLGPGGVRRLFAPYLVFLSYRHAQGPEGSGFVAGAAAFSAVSTTFRFVRLSCCAGLTGHGVLMGHASRGPIAGMGKATSHCRIMTFLFWVGSPM